LAVCIVIVELYEGFGCFIVGLTSVQNGVRLGLRSFIIETTTVRDFREKLSSWFNKAKNGTVFISRKEERFVMISEEEYFEMKDKIDSLKTSLILALSNEETFSVDEVKKSKAKKFKKAN
jgi:PHD/YefM family antitoxin component YafN of YafNO toxin-antitoxin module